MKMKRKKKVLQVPKLESLKQINPNAAGVDVGASELYVCVPEDRDPRPVRVFQTVTSDLHEIAAWLKRWRVTSVAMESTGIYWIPLYEVLEEAGFEVKLVNAREAKNMPGRKSDILDCQWIQQLHSYGLLTASFRPPRDIVACEVWCATATGSSWLVQSISSICKGTSPDESPTRQCPVRYHRR